MCPTARFFIGSQGWDSGVIQDQVLEEFSCHDAGMQAVLNRTGDLYVYVNYGRIIDCLFTNYVAN